jgi:hypothetical protein
MYATNHAKTGTSSFQEMGMHLLELVTILNSESFYEGHANKPVLRRTGGVTFLGWGGMCTYAAPKHNTNWADVAPLSNWWNGEEQRHLCMVCMDIFGIHLLPKSSQH